jgi:hypothetical protein
MTSRVNRLGPKQFGSLVFIKHDSCHLYESVILPFGQRILLWSVGGQKLMLDAFFIKVVFHLSVLKFGAIITPNLFDLSIKFILCSLKEFL